MLCVPDCKAPRGKFLIYFFFELNKRICYLVCVLLMKEKKPALSGKVLLPLMVQFCAQTTCPSESVVWFGGKLRLILKVALAPVSVGASFFRSKVTSPPRKKITQELKILKLTCRQNIVTLYFNKIKKVGLTKPAVSES